MNWKEKPQKSYSDFLVIPLTDLGILQNTLINCDTLDNEAYLLFRDLVYANGEPYFETYLDSIWDLYVLVTTANSPDVM